MKIELKQDLTKVVLFKLEGGEGQKFREWTVCRMLTGLFCYLKLVHLPPER